MSAKPIEVKPPQGGRLMSDVSAENAGIFNYAVKSEWRRVLDREARSEGYDVFNPNPLNEDAPQPPTDEPINLIAEAQSASGRRAVVVGTKTTLWRYLGVENGACFVAGVTNWVMLTARDESGVESEPSNVIHFVPPKPPDDLRVPPPWLTVQTASNVNSPWQTLSNVPPVAVPRLAGRQFFRLQWQ